MVSGKLKPKVKRTTETGIFLVIRLRGYQEVGEKGVRVKTRMLDA